MSITIYFNFIVNRDEIMNVYSIMEEYIVTIEQLEIYIKRAKTSITILLDDCPIKVIRILPFEYMSNNNPIPVILYTIQFIYYDEINTSTIHQLTLTNDGYGFSRKGRKYRISIIG